MIHNNICPYCAKEMVLKGTDVGVPLKASVEHLIPHVALSVKRGNGEGDFKACKACNIEKSKLDYVIGIIAKIQCADNDSVIETLTEVLDNPNRVKRFASMLQSSKRKTDHVELSLPLTPTEIYKYAIFLAKGQFFKQNKEPLLLSDYVVVCDLLANEFTNHLEDSYSKKHSSSPFEDLKMNPHSEVILDGECIIYSKNDEYMFVFQMGLIFIVKVLIKNQENIDKAIRSLINLGNNT